MVVNSNDMGQTPDLATLLPAFEKLVRTIAHLRSPEGCPWDREQTMASIKPYTLEETYELLEAIDDDDNDAITEELGDVLLQVVLDAQIAKDEKRFDLQDVIERLTCKMIARHPHVFGDAEAKTAQEVKQHWEKAKQAEKQRESVFEGLPRDLPALARAARLSDKAARVGFDFPSRDMLFSKLHEEVAELASELYEGGVVPHRPATAAGDHVADEPLADPAQRARAESELGDVLFVIANIARRWKLNPEQALRASNAKFERRFRAIEGELRKRGIHPAEAGLTLMDEIYNEVKRAE